MTLMRYPEAETALRSVVISGQYTLLSDYASVYTQANKNSTESIFEVQYMQGTTGLQSDFAYLFIRAYQYATYYGDNIQQ